MQINVPGSTWAFDNAAELNRTPSTPCSIERLNPMPNPIRRWTTDTKATSAVEFAMVTPAFLLILFGIMAFGAVFGVYQGVQELVAEAARASVAGLTDPERDQLARSFVASNVGAYALLDPQKLVVTTSAGSGSAFTVSIRYDMSGLFAFTMLRMIPLPSPTVLRSAVVQRGGY